MAKMDHIITQEAIRKLGRPIGQVEATQITAYITEAEQMYIKPILGDALFLDILDKGDTTYKTLLDGGSYTDEKNNIHSFMGLRVAVSYFVYAQNIMSGDFQSTRYGMVLKENDYSTHLSGKERSDAYNNALEVANRYLNECVAYCKANRLIKKQGKAFSAGSMRIRKIGV